MKFLFLSSVIFIQLFLQSSGSRKGSLAPQINGCIGKTSCGECLTGGPMCAFCTSEDYDQRNLPRCDLFGNHQGRCPSANIVYPTSSRFNIKNDAVSNAVNKKEAVQIQPQQINVNLRPNDPQKLNITIRLAENYPVDLYFLMDLSNSMSYYKDKLAAEAINIANALRTMTGDVKMGFGTFVDKPVMPFASTAPGKVLPFGYKNDLGLVSEFNIFKQEVEKAQLFGNLDFAEGGSDAIIQALSCKDQIGWRPNTRRILLFSSDADFHYAGDGKLGGIVERNDGVCNLDSTTGLYTKSLIQDYPSLGQIAAQVKQKDINLVFATPEKMYQRYKTISDFIQGSDVGIISNGSSNLVTLIQEVYRKLTSKVTLLHSEEENVSVKFYTNCNRGNRENTNTCENVKLGESITFEVEIELKSCPPNSTQYNTSIDIGPLGISEKTTVNLNYICQCDCEKPNVSVPDSPKCSSKGTEVCGTCKCNEGFFGKKCECNKTTESQLEERCKNPDTQAICSNQGLCSCGTCDCFTRTSTSAEKYSGQWCQCDDYSCPFHLGKICGGADHGTCKCGTCNCTKDYSGASCDCPTRTDTCMAKGDKPGHLCNGQGQCVCGKCQCNENYRGSTCEDCPDCKEVCRQYKPCVQCVVHKSGPYDEMECKSKCMTEGLIEEVDQLQGGADFKTCEFKDENDCRFYFSYKYINDDKLTIQARKGLDCPTEVNKVAIILGVLIPIIVIGIIAIVVYKLLIDFHDRRQLAKFEKEAAAASFSEGNPVYVDPVRHYQNPTYRGNRN